MKRSGRGIFFSFIQACALGAFTVLATQAANATPKGAKAVNPSAATKQPWEGLWARTAGECRNRESADSKTMTDLQGSENGRPAPLYDQHENHCRVDSHARQGKVITLKLTCYEFWDDYKAKKSPRRDSVTVTPLDRKKILMNGKTYMRCKL